MVMVLYLIYLEFNFTIEQHYVCILDLLFLLFYILYKYILNIFLKAHTYFKWIGWTTSSYDERKLFFKCLYLATIV